MASCMNRFFAFYAILVLCVVSSCTYSFKSGVFPHTLSIAPLENQTQNADIERILTDELLDAFIKDGRVRMESPGDFILKGIITEYTRQPSAYNSSGDIEEYRLSVKSRFSLADTSKEEVEWEKGIDESVVYPAEEDETVAISSVAERIKNSLLRIMLDIW